MVELSAFSMATNMEVYFADPGSPRERGSNENTNGPLRRYCPCGTDPSHHNARNYGGRRRAQRTTPQILNWTPPPNGWLL